MRVYILPEVRAQIMHYVMNTDAEISGVGRVQKADDGSMVVTKVYLLSQEVTGASTDIDANAIADLMYASREDKGDLNFWWHSHVNMGVFWSGTDMATIREFGRNGYLLSTVFNKKGEYRTSYFQATNGFLPELFLDAIDTRFESLPSAEESKRWSDEIKALVRVKKFEPIGLGRDYSKTLSMYNDPNSSFWNDIDDDNMWKPKNRKKVRKKDKLDQGTTNLLNFAQFISKTNTRFETLTVYERQQLSALFSTMYGYASTNNAQLMEVLSDLQTDPTVLEELVWLLQPTTTTETKKETV